VSKVLCNITQTRQRRQEIAEYPRSLIFLLGHESFGKFRELICVDHNVSELPGSRQTTLRVQTISKNRCGLEKQNFRLENNGTPGMRQRDNGNETPGHRDNGSISLRGHVKINGYVHFIDNGNICAIGPSYRLHKNSRCV
jgi:hypothetical protein